MWHPARKSLSRAPVGVKRVELKKDNENIVNITGQNGSIFVYGYREKIEGLNDMPLTGGAPGIMQLVKWPAEVAMPLLSRLLLQCSGQGGKLG